MYKVYNVAGAGGADDDDDVEVALALAAARATAFLSLILLLGPLFWPASECFLAGLVTLSRLLPSGPVTLCGLVLIVYNNSSIVKSTTHLETTIKPQTADWALTISSQRSFTLDTTS